MMLAVSMEQQPEPQQEAALSSLSWKAMALYFARTISFICSVVSIVIYYCTLLSAAVVGGFVGGEQGADLFLIHGPRLRLYAIAHTGSLDGALDQAGGLQFLQVLGYGRLRQAQDLYQVAVDTGVGLDQVLDDGDPDRMGQGLHHS